MASNFEALYKATKIVLICVCSMCYAGTLEQREDAILNILLEKLDLQEVPDVSSAPGLMPEYMKHVYELTGHYRGEKEEEVSVAALRNRRTTRKCLTILRYYLLFVCFVFCFLTCSVHFSQIKTSARR